jgi:hypothetical protein
MHFDICGSNGGYASAIVSEIDADTDTDADTGLARWEPQRQAALADFMDALDAGGLDLDADPLAFLPHLDRFVAGQDYEGFDEDDWLYLRTMIAAYVAEVLIRKHGAYWRLGHDSRGSNYMLVTTGRDGREYEVSPMDVVCDGLKGLPPEPPACCSPLRSSPGKSRPDTTADRHAVRFRRVPLPNRP